MIPRVLCLLLLGLAAGCARRDAVVLYTSQDQFYAESVLNHFRESTGLEVRPVFDTESVKTAAMAQRLRAEKAHPQCDVFWSNEEMHSRFLVQEGVLASNDWQRVGYRTRRVVINTNLLSEAQAPKSLLELTNETWRGKVALGYPLFGTTSFHFLALRQHWGDALWRAWCEGLVRNEAKVVDGNSVVVRLVGAAECAIGLTDSDDIAAGQRQSLPVAELPLNEESLVIANTIGIINGAPHPGLAEKLAEYLARPETLQQLVEVGALEGVNPAQVSGKTLTVDWSNPLVDLPAMNAILKTIFLRE